MATFGVPSPDPNLYNPNFNNPYVIGNGATSPYGAPAGQSPYGGFDPNTPGVPVLDANGNAVIDPTTGLPQTTNPTSPDTSTMGFSVTGNEANVNPNAPMQDIYAANRDTLNTTGNTIGQEAGTSLGYYGGLQTGYTGASNAALNQLEATPGYTSTQTAAIMGDPDAPVSTLNSGVSGEGAMLNAYGANLGGNLTQGEGYQNTAAGRFGTGVQEAQQGFNPLNTAVNNPNLQVGNQDVQNIVTAAGTTVGNQFQTAEDTLERQAAAAGNSSPEAMAAARQQLVTQEAATAGDTMTQAQIAAQQYQLGALQQQTGLQATAATTEEAAAQQGAEATGANTQNVANTEAQEQINAANQYGQFSVGQENTMTGQQYGAGLTAEQEASQRAGTVANQAIAGQGAYRSGVQSAEQNAQQGGQSALQSQNATYGTQTSGANAAASSQAGFTTGTEALSLGNKLGTSVANLFDEGGFVPEDMIAKVAESGPEMIVKSGSPSTSSINSMMRENMIGRYRGRKREHDDMFGVAA